MSAAPIRTLLVDDEVLARLALRQALAAHADVVIVGECGNAAEALQAIEALAPDLLFLDIRMPGMDGFKLLRRFESQTLPMVVFSATRLGATPEIYALASVIVAVVASGLGGLTLWRRRRR